MSAKTKNGAAKAEILPPMMDYSPQPDHSAALMQELNQTRQQLMDVATQNTLLTTRVDVLTETLAQKANECVDKGVTIALLQRQIEMTQGTQPHPTQQ